MFGEDSYADTYFGGSSLAGNTYTLSLADSITPVDSIVRATTKRINDTITPNEIFTHLGVMYRVLVDSVSISDVVLAIRTKHINLADFITLIDNTIALRLNGALIKWLKTPKVIGSLWNKIVKPPVQSG